MTLKAEDQAVVEDSVVVEVEEDLVVEAEEDFLLVEEEDLTENLAIGTVLNVVITTLLQDANVEDAITPNPKVEMEDQTMEDQAVVEDSVEETTTAVEEGEDLVAEAEEDSAVEENLEIGNVQAARITTLLPELNVEDAIILNPKVLEHHLVEEIKEVEEVVEEDSEVEEEEEEEVVEDKEDLETGTVLTVVIMYMLLETSVGCALLPNQFKTLIRECY